MEIRRGLHREFDGKPTLRRVIQAAFDPRNYIGVEVVDSQTQQRRRVNIHDAIAHVNELLSFYGYEIVAHGSAYDVVDKQRGEILVDVRLEPSHLSHAFIMEQIEKCRTKIGVKDYDGAITNARSMVEAVLTAIEKEIDSTALDYDGNLPRLYKRVQGHLNLSPTIPR